MSVTDFEGLRAAHVEMLSGSLIEAAEIGPNGTGYAWSRAIPDPEVNFGYGVREAGDFAWAGAFQTVGLFSVALVVFLALLAEIAEFLLGGRYARKYGGGNVKSLAQANRLKAPAYSIRAGQRLVVPSCG